MTGARTVPWLNQEIRAASLRAALSTLRARMTRRPSERERVLRDVGL